RNMPQQCRNKAARLGIADYANSEEMLEQLRSLPAANFGVFLHNHVKEPEVDFETVPLLDGDFFPDSLEELRKRATPKPMMAGVTKEEGILMIQGKKHTEEDLQEVITVAIHDARDKQKLAEELKSTYFENGIPENRDVFMRRMANIASDYWFNGTVEEMCRNTVSLQDDPVYLYIFDHFNPATMGFMLKNMPIHDATHCGELLYLFKKSLFGNSILTEEDKHVMNLFTTSFTNFAKFGNPNGPVESESDLPVYWKQLDKKNHSRNYVFTSNQPLMNETFFEGRPAKFVEIVNKHHA
ncbi:hypothetical protein PENTCL1PPCAC_7754, partial [Pristionchus entomophagus]